MSKRLRSERAWAVVTAIMVMTLMVGLGLATFAFVDNQTRQSGTERVRESTFNLAERGLDAQAFKLGNIWPGSNTAEPYPPSCTSASTDPECPDPNVLATAFDNPDLAAATEWVTQVRDNGGDTSPDPAADRDCADLNPSAAGCVSDIYDAAVLNAQPAYDLNGDDKLWVRAQARVRGERRTLASLVKVEQKSALFPDNVITAGFFLTTNNGNKVIVQTGGKPLAVRCTDPAPSACLNYDPAKGQVSPKTDDPGGAPAGPAISEEDLDGYRRQAIANDTYYTSGCPADPSSPGGVVFVETTTAVNCVYNNRTSGGGIQVSADCCNTAANPGMLIITNGRLELLGNIVFHGLIYMLNQQGWDSDGCDTNETAECVVSLGGTVTVQGGVVIDGQGGLAAGASGVNIVYDGTVRQNMVTFGSAGVLQNTFREVTSPSL
jgi:hypothetical protein